MILLDEHAVWNEIWSSFLSFSMSEAFILSYRPSYGIEWLLRFFSFLHAYIIVVQRLMLACVLLDFGLRVPRRPNALPATQCLAPIVSPQLYQ